MRVFLAAALTAISVQVHATPAMELALTDLRSNNGLALILAGEETVGRKTTEIRVNTYFVDSTTVGPRLEQYSYRGDKLIRHVVADGSVLTDYDVKLNQYTSERYDGSAGKLANLMHSLKGLVNGTAALPIRLLNDVYNPPALTWQPWMSVVEPVSESNWESYIARDERYDFKLIPNTLTSFRLTKVAYSKESTARSTSWVMDVFPGFVPAELSFKFVPPRGARAVAAGGSSKVGG